MIYIALPSNTVSLPKSDRDRPRALILTLPGHAHEMLILIAFATKPPLNAHTDVSNEARDLNLCLCLYQHSMFAYASREGSSQCAQLHRLV